MKSVRKLYRWLSLCSMAAPLLAQTPSAILVDGPGPWRDDRWAQAATEFSSLLKDAGYTITTVAPPDLQQAVGQPLTSGPSASLVAVPSLETLPVDAYTAIVNYVGFGGNLMATGGQPFRDALYLTPAGTWLDATAYQAAVGSPPPQSPFRPPNIETLSPWSQQYTTASGLRVPIARGRGLSSTEDPDGRYRVIGDLLAPTATIFMPPSLFANGNGFITRGSIIWLPWPAIADPLRAELVAALRSVLRGLFLVNAGPDQLVWLPGEDITGRANTLNMSNALIQATLQWSVSGGSGASAQPPITLPVTAGRTSVPLDIGVLPSGDYTLTFRLMLGGDEVDRIESRVRVFDPALSRQPDQKIHVENGAFYAGNRRVFLNGVNYWPRNFPGLPLYRVNSYSWLDPINYDPDVVEADLTAIASLHFNLVNIRYSEVPGWAPEQARSLMDFLERCRSHGLWARIDMPATRSDNALTGNLNPNLGTLLQAAYLPGNDRVFSYELLWEPYFGLHNSGGYGGLINGQPVYGAGRTILDPFWRFWVNDQYGSIANAQAIWGIDPPRDDTGQLTNPLDDQIANDGPWRMMVAAYRRFTEDYLGRNLGQVVREIRRNDPDTLLTYRNGASMTAAANTQTAYDIGTAAAHLDFLSPENYDGALTWPDDQKWGLVTAYSRYRTGGKPVQWAEFGYDIGPNYGTPASRAVQAAFCDAMMRQVNDDGSNAATVWWWPGGLSTGNQADFGIIDPGGTPRDCALTLSQWAAIFAASPPDLGSAPPVILNVDRDDDARGAYGLFLKWQNSYVQARQAGQRVVLMDQGTNADTSNMPLIGVGNAPYTGVGPLKFANAEFGGFHVVCPSLDVTMENGSAVQVPAGAACQITPTLINTGEAQWLPSSAPTAGVLLHTTAGDVPLTMAVPSLQRVVMTPLSLTMGQSAVTFTGRMRIQGVGDFGEALNLTFMLNSTASGPCAVSLNPPAQINAPAAGLKGNISITTAVNCAWSVSSPQTWVVLATDTGNGNAVVAYSIPANPGPARQTTITVAGHPLTVIQAAAAIRTSVPPPTLSATSVDFGSEPVGTATAIRTLSLKNTGAVPFTVSTVSIGGTNNFDFVQANNCGAQIQAAQTCTVDITFAPLAPGTRTASLFIAGNMSTGPIATNLSGTGTITGPAPAIQAIVDSWGYTAGIAPGLWVTIGGTNLAGPPQNWSLAGSQLLPATLGGVTVTFNGAPAALSYISATQINALVPSSVVPGPVQVVVDVNGLKSSAFTITASATHPAVYAPPNSDGSAFFVTAALAGTGILVGNSAADPRVLRPAYPGDTLDLYMIGLGGTADPSNFITDRVFTSAFPVSAGVTAKVGGENAPVLFAGLTAPGLYLVRISVPSNLPPGLQAVQISTESTSAGSAQTRSSLMLMVSAVPKM